MKISEFTLDKQTGVYVQQTTPAHFDYQDGGEAYLYKTLQKIKDKSSFSPEIQPHMIDFPSTYHLHATRANIFRCFDFQNRALKVLELGAGCGAITRYLGETFSHVTAMEGSIERAGIARLRCGDLDNLRIYHANFFDVAFEEPYDMVTLIGVLEYAPLYSRNKGDVEKSVMQALEVAYRTLGDQGLLVLAIENKLGLKYFSGSCEDHAGIPYEGMEGYPKTNAPVTFGRHELRGFLKGAGFRETDFFLPYPDYKLPDVIINPNVPDFDISRSWIYNFIETPFPDRARGAGRNPAFNESLVLREIVRSNLLTEFSNSFLVLAYKGDKELVTRSFALNNGWIARKYSLSRHVSYQKESTLTPEDGSLVITSRNPADREHPGGRPGPGILQHLGTERYVEGELLTYRIFEMARRKSFHEEFRDLVHRYNSFLGEQCGLSRLDEENYPLLDGKSIDLTFFNIIADEQDQWHFIDREWEHPHPVPMDHVLYRNLNHTLMNYIPYLSKKIGGDKRHVIKRYIFKLLKSSFPQMTRKRFKAARAFEASFQEKVRGLELRDSEKINCPKFYAQI